MLKRLLLILGLITSCLIFGILVSLHTKTQTAITYFPPDSSVKFAHQQTSLVVQPDKNRLKWSVSSQTDTPLYLRQDISIIFVDGWLRAIHNKWLPQTDYIFFQESLPLANGKWESITLHHGESHKHKHSIKSIQQMSYSRLYVKDHLYFQRPQNLTEEMIQTTLDSNAQDILNTHWTDLMSYFHINPSDYNIIPLTALYTFNEQNFPSFSKEKTKEINGQLWEGLYKNFLLPIVTKNQPTSTYVPIILIHKKQDHLLVLFEINQQKQKLKQKISIS